MARGATRALIVDDLELSRRFLGAHLAKAGYETLSACDGAEAMEVLEREGDDIDVILLDRRMPNMDGMEVMARIKAEPALRDIPVIMETAADRDEEIAQGIQAGVFYYLTKPIDGEVLISITAAAVADHARRRRLQEEVRKRAGGMTLLTAGTFSLRTIEEANNLAVTLAGACPDSRAAVIGLSELLINAVEHGNLEIGYQGKSDLIAAKRLKEEVEERLSRPGTRDKSVTVEVTRSAAEIAFVITDAGPGFDYRGFLDMDPARTFDSHGRGIALARKISFSSLEYRGRGNQVAAAIDLGGIRKGK